MRLTRAACLRTASLAALSAVLQPPAAPAHAWCGEKVPGWAYFLKWDERPVPFIWEGVKAEVLCRVVGDKGRESKTGVPPVLLVGNPGVGYDYLENLEGLTVSDRRVIEVVFAGTRPGGAPLPASIRGAEACAAQLRAVCSAIGVPRVHVLAHGSGALPALRLLRDGGGPALRSLALVSPYGSAADLKAAARPAAGEPAARALARLLPTSDAAAPATCIAEATAGAAPWLLGDDGGGGERLGSGGALAAQLAAARDAKVATLVVWGGPRDVVEPSWDVQALQGANANLRVYEASGHLPFIEQREEFAGEYLSFLDAADGVTTSRELILDPSIEAIKAPVM